MFINQHSINFKNCRKPWYLSSIETTVKDDAQRACFACSCCYYYLLSRNPILFLTIPLNSTGCGFCQYFRGNHQTTHNYTASLKGVYWSRFLSVEHNQTKNRRIGRAGKQLPRYNQIHNWNVRLGNCILGHKSVQKPGSKQGIHPWRANALHYEKRGADARSFNRAINQA